MCAPLQRVRRRRPSAWRSARRAPHEGHWHRKAGFHWRTRSTIGTGLPLGDHAALPLGFNGGQCSHCMDAGGTAAALHARCRASPLAPALPLGFDGGRASMRTAKGGGSATFRRPRQPVAGWRPCPRTPCAPRCSAFGEGRPSAWRSARRAPPKATGTGVAPRLRWWPSFDANRRKVAVPPLFRRPRQPVVGWRPCPRTPCAPRCGAFGEGDLRHGVPPDVRRRRPLAPACPRLRCWPRSQPCEDCHDNHNHDNHERAQSPQSALKDALKHPLNDALHTQSVQPVGGHSHCHVQTAGLACPSK